LHTFANVCYRMRSKKKAIASILLPVRTSTDVGALMRARRKALGWDQAELAAKAGVSRLWVNQMERGKQGASLALVLATLSVLGVTLHAGTSDNETMEGLAEIPVIDIDAIVDAARAPRSGSVR
jgi:HTH-type transcriptional regulator / antitoxin HipB